MYSPSTFTQFVQPASPTALVVAFSTLLVGTGTMYGMENSEEWRHYVQPRVPFVLDSIDGAGPSYSHPSVETTGRLDLRTPAEHIGNLRNVLNPSVTDLASLFEVSRQAIYKWLSGSTPDQSKLDRIIELSRIADAFRASGIARPGPLLKMKIFSGESLMDILRKGASSSTHVAALIKEAKLMEAAHKRSGLSSSKAKPTNDWLSSISIPGSTERS